MTEERIAQLEALYRRTTPGAWAYDLAGLVVAKPDTALHDGIAVASLYDGVPELSNAIANGEWIADVHESFEDLLAEVRGLREQVRLIQSTVDDFYDDPGPEAPEYLHDISDVLRGIYDDEEVSP